MKTGIKPVGNRILFGIITAAFLICPAGGRAQYFGKNKVQYRDFDWRYVQSRHFDVYYYDDQKHLAEFTADVAESSYVELKRDLRHDIEKRIPILVYNGHNDFQQTNASQELISESVGGFTEFLKDRIVIPFQGNYDEFRHVIHHELTHAYMLQVFYGGGVGSMLTGMTRFQLPLWLVEGLAEYESLGWDTDSDMYMRDATINGYVPPISQMYGYLVYKGGQSVLNYIAEKYGSPKIGEILASARIHKSVDRGFKQTIGVDLEELSKRWQKYLRKNYWPDIENRDEPEDMAKRLTDHTKKQHFLNNSPALSPRGDRLVFISDQSDYMDIYVMRAIDGKITGKLVKGQRSDLFENLHWLRPGMDWSPDGSRVIFAAKSGAQDAIYIVQVDSKKILHQLVFDMNGVYSPAWSPVADKICFMGVKNGKSDIFVYDLETSDLMQITDDIFSDLDPAWSPDGRKIVFVSDRQSYESQPPGNFSIQRHSYQQYDIYTIDVETRNLERYTYDEATEHSPAFSPDGKIIAFVSDRNGINNIFMMDRSTRDSYPITNLLSGVSQMSWSRDGSRMAFASFFRGGYDIYLINNPLDTQPGSIVLENTTYIKNRETTGRESFTYAGSDVPGPEENPPVDYRNFVFDDKFRDGILDKQRWQNQPFLDSEDYKNEQGDYKTRKYKIRFTPDLITGGAGYSQFFGLQGSSMIAFSDVLGNHQINFYTDLFYNIKNSNFQLSYYYLPRQIDFGISAFHYSYLFYTYYQEGGYLIPGYLRDRNYGLSVYASRPFNRFRRLDFGLTGMVISRDYGSIDPYAYYYYGDYYEAVYEMNDLGNLYKRQIVLMNLGYTSDTVVWGTTGPANGGRSQVSFSYSPLIGEQSGLEFWTIRGDWRKYLRLKKDFALVLRIASGYSGGRNPQRFLLGGMDNWINYKYAQYPTELYTNDSFFFSSYITPLRGALYYEMIGSRFFLTNLEIRFPMIQYLILGWPLPLGFQNIRGVVFMDVGSAWNDSNGWKPFVVGSSGYPRLKESWRAGYGVGARVNMGFLLIRYDLAWSTDFASTSAKPISYFSLGAEF